MDKAGYSVRDARGEASLLGEMFGIHLPRHVQTFIAEIPAVGTALNAAFAATAILFLVEALAKGVEKIVEWSQESQKLAEAQAAFTLAAQNSFNSLDDKLLESGIRIDELRGNHLAALQKELELIDHQKLNNLVTEFDTLSKAADAVFAQLTADWYSLEIDSKGAAAALHGFKAQYDSLLAQGKDKEASDLLAGTLQSAKDYLTTLQQAKKAQEELKATDRNPYQFANTWEGPGQKELDSQKQLIAALEAQLVAQQKLNAEAKNQDFLKTNEEDTKITKDKNAQLAAQFKIYADITKGRQDAMKEVAKDEQTNDKLGL